MRCIRCHYDLRGTSRSGDCPECGLPAAASEVAIARLVEDDDPTLPSVRTALDLFGAGAVLVLVTAPAALVGVAIDESLRQGGPKLGSASEMRVLVVVTLGLIVTLSATAIAAGLRTLLRVLRWPIVPGERGLPGFVNVVLASALTVGVIFAIAVISSVSRGESEIAPIALTLWLLLLPLRALVLVEACEFAVRIGRPPGRAAPGPVRRLSARSLSRSMRRASLVALWCASLALGAAAISIEGPVGRPLLLAAILCAAAASALEVLMSAETLGAVTAAGRSLRRALAERRAPRE